MMEKTAIKTLSPNQKSARAKAPDRKARRIEPDLAWVRARRALLKRVREEVARRTGPESADLRAYRRSYEKELSGRWSVSSKSELVSEIETADIVYGGDFHALGSSQRTHLKILRAVSADRPVVLALECFAKTAQKWIDLYLCGAIHSDELKKRVRWKDSWGFPWENYRPLLELAKKRGFAVIGLSEPPASRAHLDLALRDKNAAARIRTAYISRPGALIYVIFGDLHIASRHLPKLVSSGFKRASVRDVIVHLNSDKIYFQLARKGLELSVDVVRLGAKSNQFCVMSTPPWVQWQSYLLFLERADLAGLRGDPELDREEDSDDFDPTDQIAGLVRLAARDLGVEVSLNDFSAYSADAKGVWQSLERLKKEERVVARLLLASGASFYLPATGVGYLARPTVNHAAALAGQYLHAILSRRDKTPWTLPRDFPALIWIEAVSYFFSKLINHKRQSETIADLRAQLALSSPSDRNREALRLVLDRSMSELVYVKQGRRRPLQVRPRQKASYFEAARVLGGMMGERLYMAFRSRKLNRREILQLLKRDVAAKSFPRDYEDILRLMGEASSVSPASRRERL